MALPLWDLPTRIFHWSVAALVPAAWVTAETGNFEAHLWIGCTFIVLVLTRVVWGFSGSEHARFADFVVGPAKVMRYLRSGQSNSAGHNPLGGWSVLLLLSLLLLQAVSGLFNSDDVLFSGPLYYSAPDELRGVMGEVHEWAFNLLLGIVALHIFAVLYYQLRRKQPLLQAMLRGSAPGREGRALPVPSWRAIVWMALFSLFLWWGLSLAPQPQPISWS